MFDIQNLLDKRATAWNTAKNFLDTHNANGVMSAEDSAQYDRMEKDISDLSAQIERLQRANDMENALSQPMNTAITSRPQPASDPEAKKTEYAKAFNSYLRSGGKVINAALQVGTDSEGGYLVPDEFEKTLVKALDEANVMRRLCKVIRTASGDRLIPVVANHASAAWTAEESAYTESEPTFSQISLNAHKLGILAKVSEELLHDSVFDLQAFLAEEFARAIGIAEETAFITGNGTGKPTGLLDATYGAGTGVTTASSTAITADEVIDTFYSVKAPYRPRASWLLNDGSVKALRKLKDGQGNYLWQPAISAGSPDMVLGRPIYTSAQMPTIEAGAKVAAFGDFSYYWIADRQNRTLKVLNEIYAPNGQVGFIGSERVDGKLVLTEAIKTLTMKS